MSNYGFKEWKVVCDAIGSGRQDIIFRKGGIHEGREGFSFKHEAFYLFPTLFHAQEDFVTEGTVEGNGGSEGDTQRKTEWQVGDELEIEYFCTAKSAITLEDWDAVCAYSSRHIWTESTIRERFDWEGKGMASGSIHVVELNVEKLATPWKLTYEKKYGGCRSWIDLPKRP